ncbi:MAG: hypothetical protein HXM37_05935 [Isoptericola variabilis]|nr:hypothetical protein [Isoptericola variabilis]
MSWAFVCLRVRRAVAACEQCFRRVWSERSALVSNENEAGSLGGVPASLVECVRWLV